MQLQDKEKLSEFLHKLKHRSKTYIGYPAGIDFDYKELYPFLDFNLNNVGDPSLETNVEMHTKASTCCRLTPGIQIT